MKKIVLSISILILANAVLLAQDTLVFWNFKTAPYDTLADGGNPANSLDLISRDTSWHNAFSYSAGALGTPDKCISSKNWTNGNGMKYYQIGFSSDSFNDLVFYSRQRSSSTGPKYFKVQYKITGGGTWTDIAGGSVVCADDFTSGTLAGVSLPPACNNQPELYLRWIMTSDTSVQDSIVKSTGTSRIDEIYIISTTTMGTKPEAAIDHFRISPNPCDGYFMLEQNSDAALEIEVLDIAGKTLFHKTSESRIIRLDVPEISRGLYFLKLTDQENKNVHIQKLVVR